MLAVVIFAVLVALWGFERPVKKGPARVNAGAVSHQEQPR